MAPGDEPAGAEADPSAASEQEIRDACMRYWAGFDRHDLDLYLSAFTPDATMSLFGGSTTVEVATIDRGSVLGGHYAHSHHIPGSQVITVTGDRAVADTLAVAHLVSHDGLALVRGLRYVDDLVQTEDGWRIATRRHSVLWQYDVATVAPHVPPAEQAP